MISDLLRLVLALSIPFMLGVAVGRGFRHRPPTREHNVGSLVLRMASSVRDTTQFTGAQDVIVTGWGTLTGNPELYLFVTTKDEQPVIAAQHDREGR